MIKNANIKKRTMATQKTPAMTFKQFASKLKTFLKGHGFKMDGTVNPKTRNTNANMVLVKDRLFVTWAGKSKCYVSANVNGKYLLYNVHTTFEGLMEDMTEVVELLKKEKVKTEKKPAAKAKVTTPAKTKKVKEKTSDLPKGYKITKIEKELNLIEPAMGKDVYELYEVSGAKVPKPKYFISMETARKFVAKTEALHTQVKAASGKGHAPVGMSEVAKATKDILAASELEGVSEGPKSDRKAAKVMYSDSE